MSAGKAFIAGIGCKKGASAAEILTALDAAMTIHGVRYDALECLATGAIKMDERGIEEAAEQLELDIAFVDKSMLAACDERLLTRSSISLRETGSASLSEAAALAAGGPFATLLGPRLALGSATCALVRIEIPEERA